MKRILMCMLVLVAAFECAAASPCLQTGVKIENSSAADTVFFYTRDGRRFDANALWIMIHENASGPVTIQRGVRISADSISFIDDVRPMEPGASFEADDHPNIYCFRFIKSSAADEINYSASTCGTARMLAKAGFDISSTKYVTLVSGYNMTPQDHKTFPRPLLQMDDYNRVDIIISCETWPDTLWWMFAASNSPMDSLTVASSGGVGVLGQNRARFLNYIVKADMSGVNSDIMTKCKYLNLSTSGTWQPTGLYFTAAQYGHVIQGDENYTARPKFGGMRVGASATQGITGLKIFAILSKTGECEGR